MSDSESSSTTHSDVELVPNLDSKYICPVCLGILKDPVQTRCGHRFCGKCLRLTQTGRYTRCPVDKEWYDAQAEVFADIAIHREVQSLTARCPRHVDGCLWKGELRMLVKHKAICPEAFVNCNHDCGSVVRRGDIGVHESTCVNRTLTCEFCNIGLRAYDLSKHHVLSCERFPVTCSLCCECGIVREDMRKHISAHCAMTTVECPFKPLGCTYTCTRMKLNAHYEDNCHQHMTLFITKLDELASSLNGQQSLPESMPYDRANHQTELIWQVSTNRGLHRSPPLITGVPGYRFSLSLRTSGCHASLMLNLEAGRHDNSLKFPVSGSCHLTLIDQTGTSEHEKALINFEKLTKSEFGYQQSRVLLSKFTSSSNFCRGRYVKNKAAFMKIYLAIY